MEEYIGEGTISRVEDIVSSFNPRSIFIVAGKKSLHASGAFRTIDSIRKKYKSVIFSDFSSNPTLEDIKSGVKVYRALSVDMVIAVGGGSAIDVAKIINVVATQRTKDIEVYMTGKKSLEKTEVPLMAIPTTAGTGSEATHFAAVYINKKKHSVTHDSMLPKWVIVDPRLSYSLPRNITACTGMDALCQSIESYWSINSTDESKTYAQKAICLAMDNLESAVNQPTSVSRIAMSEAAHLSGKSINITKTTAPHAISYVLTSYFGIPHGHAVALTIGKIIEYNSQGLEEDIVDPRGIDYVKKTINQVSYFIGFSDPKLAGEKVEKLMKSIGLEAKLSVLGINKSDIKFIANNVNFERMKNNPRSISSMEIEKILESIL